MLNLWRARFCQRLVGDSFGRNKLMTVQFHDLWSAARHMLVGWTVFLAFFQAMLSLEIFLLRSRIIDLTI